jgi:hypothetical protein
MGSPEQQSGYNKTRACRTCLIDSVVKKAEQCFIMDILLSIIANIV